MNDGWVSIHRCIENNPLWLKEPFTKGQAWIDLIIFANHEDGYFWVRDIKVDIKRGQIGWSERTMAKRWKWSRGKVRRFITQLKKDGNIVPQVVPHVTTIITLVNYDTYQTDKRKTVPHSVPQPAHTRYTNNKNNKNNKNTGTKKSKYKTLDSITPKVIYEIAEKQKLSIKTVESIYEDLQNYCGAHNIKYDNYRLALNSFIKRALRSGEIKPVSAQMKQYYEQTGRWG